jgi:hypothetical protein
MAGNATLYHTHGHVICFLLSRIETQKYQLFLIFLLLQVYVIPLSVESKLMLNLS